MAFDDGTMLSDDLGFMIADLESTLVWLAQSVSCTKGAVAKSENLEFEGIFKERDLEVAVKVSDFTSNIIPPIGTKITIDGTKFRVESSSQDAANIGATLQITKV